MAVGGSNRFPSLQIVADLFRAQINDTFAGATNTPGEGLIMPNTNPDLLTFLSSAVRDVYSDLRNVGDPSLILDNYILYGIPALSAPNPAVQVSLDSIGYFDGFQFNPQWTLPANCLRVEKVWERPSTGAASQDAFTPLSLAPFGLPGVVQGNRMGQWEIRQNAVWMPGAMVSVDLRLRCTITFPDYLGTAIDFTATYIPVLDCANAVVAKMLVLYAKRFAPEQFGMALQEDERFIGKLRSEVVRQMQNTEYQRTAFGEQATASGFGWLQGL